MKSILADLLRRVGDWTKMIHLGLKSHPLEERIAWVQEDAVGHQIEELHWGVYKE